MMAWLCICELPTGETETTLWLTDYGAAEMALETEAEWRRKRGKAVCRVVPDDGSHDTAPPLLGLMRAKHEP
jgi:hypothetical protein